MKQVYLDYNSTTPLDPRVKKKILDFMDKKVGNPSSLHSLGLLGKELLEEARSLVAQTIGAKDSEILFTSGGTEANALALQGVAREAKKEGKKHILASAIEHPSILKSLDLLKKEGFQIEYLPVDQRGCLRLDGFSSYLRKDTALVSIMAGNNETGALQPIQEVGEILENHPALFHCDAVQALGKMEIHVDHWKVDLLSLSSHKIYGPTGVGALFLRKGTKIQPLLPGHQERGLRGGTENLLSIVGFGEACKILLEKDLAQERQRIQALRDRFYEALKKELPWIKINTPLENSLPNTLNLELPGWEGERLLFALDMKGIAVSLGSACSSGSLQPSHVLLAMGRTPKQAMSSIRLSLGRETTQKELDYTLEAFLEITKSSF